MRHWWKWDLATSVRAEFGSKMYPSQLCPLVLCCISTHSRAVKATSPFQGESSLEQKSPELQPPCQEIEMAPSPNQERVQVMIRWEWDHPPQDAL